MLFIYKICCLINSGLWSTWQKWSGCSHSCGTGVQIRKRNCNETDCIGKSVEEKRCGTVACPSKLL